MPLPPYIASQGRSSGSADYRDPFSPMTEGGRRRLACILRDRLWAALQERGVALHKVTLHVGAGILPHAHDMAEFGTVPFTKVAETRCCAASEAGRIS